jgi:imidazolonepropionase-like amidohydrolase
MQRLEAALLVPGRGEPVRDGVVLLDGETISYAGPAATAPASPQAEVVRAAAVMPGLWDCHGHLLGIRSLDFERLVLEPEPLRAARCAADLRAALDAGVTSVREVGGLGVYLSRAVDEGSLVGPEVHGAGAILSMTGGHGDLHELPLQWQHDVARRGGELRLCDGEADCARAAREQLRKGARVIKVCASGGALLSEVDDPIRQQFTVRELRAIVEVAGTSDRLVAAHCHGKPGIMAALEAGVATIEHGTYLDEEVCAAMRETGAVLVPTSTILEEATADSGVPSWASAKLSGMAEAQREAIALAHQSGVPIAAGTDISTSGCGLPNSWGRNGREPVLLTRAGLSPLAAIEAATANGPLTLGPQAPVSGQQRAGYPADVLALDADPVADIAVLADPDRITGVWRAGVRLKG